MGKISIKRIYEPYAASDGFRILVDRLWPRGLKKEDARVDRWMKEVAPSSALRKWFDHDPAKWAEFTHWYQEELQANPAFAELTGLIKEKGSAVTLLYAAKDEAHNQAVVLQGVIDGR